jgi:hypothetical protein
MEYPSLLIAGDSFVASHDSHSWTNLIQNYHVTNIGTCGIGEYKIWQALITQDITRFDKIIIAHTSAARLHIKQNPWYLNHQSHAHADLLYSDACAKPDSKFKTLVKSWFEQVVDLDYQDNIHAMIVEKIQHLCSVSRTKHITFFDYNLPNLNNINTIWTQYPGSINHLSIEGNQKVFEYIRPFLYDNSN